MPEYFDIDNLDKQVYNIGKLNQRVINLLNLNLAEADILVSVDKIRYTRKHEHKFNDYQEYKRHVELVPDIISNPTYVGLHPTEQSIEYIKILDKIMVVPIRYRAQGHLWMKTAFPISQGKLSIYLNSGTLKEYVD